MNHMHDKDGEHVEAVITQVVSILTAPEVIDQIIAQSAEWVRSQQQRHGVWGKWVSPFERS